MAERDAERVSSSRPPQVTLSVHSEDRGNELDFQTALHVLVQAHMGAAVLVIEFPGTQLAYVAFIVPQNPLLASASPAWAV